MALSLKQKEMKRCEKIVLKKLQRNSWVSKKELIRVLRGTGVSAQVIVDRLKEGTYWMRGKRKYQISTVEMRNEPGWELELSEGQINSLPIAP